MRQPSQNDPLNIREQIQQHLSRIVAYNARQDNDGVIEEATTIINLHSKNAGAYRARAESNGRLGKYQEVIADATQAIALDSKNAGAYCIRAESNRCLGKYQKAIADATQAIALDNTDATGYRIRATIYEKIKEDGSAFLDQRNAFLIESKKKPLTLMEYAKFFILHNESRIVARGIKKTLDLFSLRATLSHRNITPQTIALTRAAQGYRTDIPDLFNSLKTPGEKYSRQRECVSVQVQTEDNEDEHGRPLKKRKSYR